MPDIRATNREGRSLLLLHTESVHDAPIHTMCIIHKWFVRINLFHSCLEYWKVEKEGPFETIRAGLRREGELHTM